MSKSRSRFAACLISILVGLQLSNKRSSWCTPKGSRRSSKAWAWPLFQRSKTGKNRWWYPSPKSASSVLSITTWPRSRSTSPIASSKTLNCSLHFGHLLLLLVYLFVTRLTYFYSIWITAMGCLDSTLIFLVRPIISLLFCLLFFISFMLLQ